jgi:hypothetical protein
MWPHQTEVATFYGNPRGRNGTASKIWEKANLVTVVPPYQMYYAGKPISSFRVHKKCAAATVLALKAIFDATKGDKKLLTVSGANVFGGSYCFRLMRGSNHLSMHSYGCAIDLDPASNSFHDTTPNFLRYPFIIKAFEDQGATWGGNWTGSSRDGMHFQFAHI